MTPTTSYGHRFTPFRDFASFKPRVYRSANPDPWRASWIDVSGRLVEMDCQTWDGAFWAALDVAEALQAADVPPEWAV